AAMQLVAESTDERACLDVCVAAGSAFADLVHPRERIPVNTRVVELARARGDRALELRGLSRLITDHVQAGDFARAAAVLAQRDALARALIQPRFQWHGPLFHSMRAMIGPEISRCDALIAEAAAYADHDVNCARTCAIHRTWMLLAADRVDDLVAHEPV